MSRASNTVPASPLRGWSSTGGVRTITFGEDQPLHLSSGEKLAPLTIGYETYGELAPDKSNAVLVCHALTMDQYVASPNPATGRPGWWPRIVGPGKPIDTNRFFVICANVLGGCMGTSGPTSMHPDGRAYGLRFPVFTVADMVRAQAMLVEALGIPQLFCVIGGSIGGMQALQWAAAYPNRVFSCVPIATAARHSAQNIAFYEVGRQAIMADPEWREGDYLAQGTRPSKGLAVARMAAHITYLSEQSLHQKFDRALQEREKISFGFDADFQVESYLRHQGQSFVDRFDANSYLYITRAVDYFDLAGDFGGSLPRAFHDCPSRFCAFAFSSDWHYPPEGMKHAVRALIASGCEASYVEVESDKGHDAFLLEEPAFEHALAGFIDAAAQARGLTTGAAR
ncbi:MAG: homoserine O-acetyltransferase [Alphaproteobacteria bacterium]|nr:homoserine O-acetyltransferase [Alphaproteobacteria bacterium]